METRLQQERRERAEAKAGGLELQAERYFQTAHDATKHIPFGQPILVGHHSERHHRRDVERGQRAATKGVEASRAASQAKWAAGNSGRAITADDPEAVVALKDKLSKLENEREQIKAVNKAFRKGGWKAVGEIIGEERAARCEARLPDYEKKPFPAYVLQNLGANIRRVKGRIEELQVAEERPEAEPVEGDGFTIEEDKDDCRIRFYFDERPDRETCRLMRRNGFKFSRANLAWQRLLNAGGRYACLSVAKELFGYEPTA